MTIVIAYKWSYFGLVSFDFLNSFGNTAAFISISYFVGVILQEMGSAIQRIAFFRNGEPSETFLSENSKILSKKERVLFIELVKSKYDNDFDDFNKEDCRIVFNYINNYLVTRGLSEKGDKMQALFGLSRGLFCSFSACAIGIIIVFAFCINDIRPANMIICLCVCLLASAFLYQRTLRYAKIRVKNVCQLYYIQSQSIIEKN